MIPDELAALARKLRARLEALRRAGLLSSWARVQDIPEASARDWASGRAVPYAYGPAVSADRLPIIMARLRAFIDSAKPAGLVKSRRRPR